MPVNVYSIIGNILEVERYLKKPANLNVLLLH